MFSMNRNWMGPQNNFAPTSNKIVVKSLEDALRRYADFNSEMLYIDANKNLLYNVYTDVRGEKTYDVYEVRKQEQPQTNQQTDNDKIMSMLQELNTKVEDLYGKYNAQQTGSKSETK